MALALRDVALHRYVSFACRRSAQEKGRIAVQQPGSSSFFIALGIVSLNLTGDPTVAPGSRSYDVEGSAPVPVSCHEARYA